MFINITLDDGTLVDRIHVDEDQVENPGPLTWAVILDEVRDGLRHGVRMVNVS